MPHTSLQPRLVAALGALALAAAAAGCGSASGSGSAPGAAGDPVTLHLGYFPNLTHAPALIGIDKGFIAGDLGRGATLHTTSFNAGPAAIEALLGGSLDATYVGPNPAINGFIRSHGGALRLVRGATAAR